MWKVAKSSTISLLLSSATFLDTVSETQLITQESLGGAQYMHACFAAKLNANGINNVHIHMFVLDVIQTRGGGRDGMLWGGGGIATFYKHWVSIENVLKSSWQPIGTKSVCIQYTHILQITTYYIMIECIEHSAFSIEHSYRA